MYSLTRAAHRVRLSHAAWRRSARRAFRATATVERKARGRVDSSAVLGGVVTVWMNLYELSTTTNSLRQQAGAVPVNVVTRRIVRYIHNLGDVKRDAHSVVSVSQTVTYGLKDARLIKMPVVMTANRRLLYHDRLAVGGFERETKPHMRWSSDVGHEVATTMFGELWHERESRPTVGVTGDGAGVDSVWERKKIEARKMLENAARRGAAVPSVQCTLCWAASHSL